jgi:hypothetical protein
MGGHCAQVGTGRITIPIARRARRTCAVSCDPGVSHIPGRSSSIVSEMYCLATSAWVRSRAVCGALHAPGTLLRKEIAASRQLDPAYDCGRDCVEEIIQRGTEVCTCALKRQPGVSTVQSQIEIYRAKAKEFARLTVVAKSLRDSRQYRKLAEMYWAFALGEEANR